jgi:hypothetical protein
VSRNWGPGAGPRPKHIITTDEVGAWLSDSVVKRVTFHRTSPEAARRIMAEGIDPEASEQGAYGQGFYTATETEEFYGLVELAVAIKTRNPLVGSMAEIEPIIDAMGRRLRPRSMGRMTRDVAAAVRQELINLKYDGLVIFDAGGDGVDYVVAILGETTKVVMHA